MLEMHRDTNSLASESARAAAAAAGRMFEETATPSSSSVRPSTDAPKPESSSGSWLTFGTNLLYGLENKLKNVPGDGASDAPLKPQTAGEQPAKPMIGKEAKGKELKTDNSDGLTADKELKDLLGQGKEQALKLKEQSPNDEAIAIKQKLNALKEMELQLKKKLAALKDELGELGTMKDQLGTMKDQNPAGKIGDGKPKKDPIDVPAVPKETQPLKPKGASDAGQAAPERIPPAVEDEATDAAQPAKPVKAGSESQYVQGEKLTLKHHDNDDLTASLGTTQFTQRADGTAVIESQDRTLKLAPDGHVTLKVGGREEHYSMNQANGTADLRLPDGTLITRKGGEDGNFSGFVVARPGQPALETFNDHRVVYGRALRK